ncbi:dTDP-4-dehydrorhamnose 3,5-epimerase [Planctomycetota bacterium]
MDVKKLKLPDVLLLEPEVFSDERGFFFETFNSTRYEQAGICVSFVQDNISYSQRGTLRGLHFQYPQSQGKLVHVISGRVVDVAVDIRINSPTFGQWLSEELSDANHKQIYIPPGFAHGFSVTSETALFLYKCTDFYNPVSENGIIWNDPDLGINWPVTEPILSPKDAKYTRLKDIPNDKLPKYERS